MLATSVVRDVSELRALVPAWDELLARAVEDELPLSASWLLPWWEVFGDRTRRLSVLAFRDGERLVGLAPLLARRHRYRRAIPFRRLELLGSGEAKEDETCGDYLGLVAERGREADVARAFAGALAEKTAGGWDELVLASMSGESPVPALVRDACAARGFRVAFEEHSCAPYVPLPKTWDEYVGALKSNKRNQLKKALKAFEAWAGGVPAVVRAKGPADLDEAKRVLERLHGERWSSGGVFASSKFRAFHDRLMPQLLAKDALSLGWIAVRGEPIVAFYNFEWKGKVSFYQAGRRVDVPDEVRVGVTMHAYLIRDAIERGMREYDFLEGESQYKMSLALATRPLVRMRVVRPGSLRETARLAAERGVELAKRVRTEVEQRRGRHPNG